MLHIHQTLSPCPLDTQEDYSSQMLLQLESGHVTEFWTAERWTEEEM